MSFLKQNPFLAFNKHQRSGLLILAVLIVILQVAFFLVNSQTDFQPNSKHPQDLSAIQKQIDSLKSIEPPKDTIYPFNPNYITDYKGYLLGMSLEEINRLHTFRALGKYVNSADEFQEVTQVSDSLIEVISPSFKFPEWVKKNTKISSTSSQIEKNAFEKPVKKVDLNTADAEQLKKINGIGDKLSERIISFRNRLGGFLVDAQLYDVYGLDSVVVKRTLDKFTVLTKPAIEKIDLNEATYDQLRSIVYINGKLAGKILDYRRINGTYKSLEELTKIEDFPADRLPSIALYLYLK
ncbi:MAG: helix-hairpin-helix domain-containing protein [Flavobacteriaceae bacterium]|nr:helix-hairpin-helix domain-containing protein [Flavobacteriaceae bacterium]MDZ4148476.1 helix-hairpin-helix domain-containing protein [Flavobacteriaceae bacterium]